MKETTIIIPIEKYGEEEKEYLKKAIDSIYKQSDVSKTTNYVDENGSIQNEEIVYTKEEVDGFLDIMVVGSKDFEKDVTTDFQGVKYLNSKDTTIQGNINYGVKNVETEFFTYMEYDDQFNKNWLYHTLKQIKDNTFDFITSINVNIDSSTGNVIVPFDNVLPHSAMSVSDPLVNSPDGTLENLPSLDTLSSFNDLKLSGASIRVDSFKESGMLKKNIKLSFDIELILRMLHRGYKLISINKALYIHVKNREGSFADKFLLSQASRPEVDFWKEIAMKNYRFRDEPEEIDYTNLEKVEQTENQTE